MSRFQIILFVICGVGIVVGVLIFSGFIPTGSKSSSKVNTGLVVVWGTLPSKSFDQISNNLSQKDKTLNLRYIQMPADSIRDSLVEAIADGNPPDLILYSSDMLVELQNRINPIPYTVYPSGTFSQTYVQSAEMLMNQDGIIGIPLGLDPLILYYNRDILANNGFALPIQYWDEAGSYVDKIKVKTIGTTLTKEAFGLGLYDNVANAKAIISTLFLQSGNKIVEPSMYEGSTSYKSVIASGVDKNGASIGESILKFYTRFTDPYDELYTWNRSLPNTREAFLSGDLAYYFGFGSELLDLRARNPNLNFAPTAVPQIRGASSATFGKLYILSQIKGGLNSTGAFSVLISFSDPDIASYFDTGYGLASVHRSKIAENSTQTSYANLFNNQSLIAKSWFDPSSTNTDAIFRDMIQNIVTGKLKIGEALNQAQELINS